MFLQSRNLPRIFDPRLVPLNLGQTEQFYFDVEHGDMLQDLGLGAKSSTGISADAEKYL